jgi:medium-chain acyl-[acyl-carrier-protein] hydrolase
VDLQAPQIRTMPAAEAPWLVPPANSKPHALVRVFCFAFAGGSALQFREWDAAVSAEVQILGIQLPGHDYRRKEPLPTRVHDLMATMGPGLAPYLDRPFALLGQSLGALLAFELARWLRRNGLPDARHLFVASRPAPHLPHGYEPVHELPEQRLFDVLRLYGGTSEEVLREPELMRFFLPVIRADLEMNRCSPYVDEPPLDVAITAFGGHADPVCKPFELAAWREQTTKAFDLIMMEGGHFVVHSRSRDTLRHVVSKCLGDHASGTR